MYITAGHRMVATTPTSITRAFRGSAVKSASFPEVSVDSLWTDEVHCAFIQKGICFILAFSFSHVPWHSPHSRTLHSVWFLFRQSKRLGSCMSCSVVPRTMRAAQHTQRVHKTLRYFLGCVSHSVRLFVTPYTVAHQVLCPCNSPDKNTGVGCHFFLQRIFQTQGVNQRLLCCKWSPALQADSLPAEPPVQFSHSIVSDSFDPMNCSTPGLPVHHQLRESTQIHFH